MNLNQRILGAVATALALSAAAFTPTPAAARTADQRVTYQGHVFHVPADWPVVDLAADPRTCVRFDQHAVYLGSPAAEQDCPTHAVGRTEALLVEPATTNAPGTTVNPVSHEIVAADAGVRVTGTFGTDQALVSGILADAGLPTSPPAPPARPRAAAVPQATASAVASSATNYTGKGFDTCTAPSSSTMSGWITDSPYNAVGIYIGGADRACAQPNLSASWVQQQAAGGWRFMPLYVGLQAGQISSPGSQGTAAADDAVNQAANLGFGPGSLLYYDMENYSSGYSGTVLSFLSAWTDELHARGYNSAVYSSSSSGIADLARNVGSYTMPDAVFTANWNGAADTNDPALPGGDWANHQRVHQYSGNVTETWHGVSLNIDQDYLDVQLAGAPASPTSGQFFHDIRLSNGSWTAFGALDGVGGAAGFKGPEAAIAGMPDGTAQVLGIGTDGNVYHETRLTSGSWTGLAPLNGVGTSTMQASKIAITGMPDGSSQVLAVGSDGNVYHEIRATNGSWSGFAPLNGVGTPTMQAREVAIAGMPDGSSQVVAVGNDGNVYHETRATNGSWTGFAQLNGVGTPTMQASKVAITAMPDGSTQVLAVGSDGNVYHEIRATSGSWSGFAPLGGVGTPAMQASAVGIAGMPDGSSQVLAIGNDHNVYHEVRAANGSWSGFQPIAGVGGAPTFAAQRAAITGLPDGSAQLLATGL